MNINNNMFNVLRNISYVLIPVIIVCLFNRIIECFKGKVEARAEKSKVSTNSSIEVNETNLNQRSLSQSNNNCSQEIKSISESERKEIQNQIWRMARVFTDDPEKYAARHIQEITKYISRESEYHTIRSACYAFEQVALKQHGKLAEITKVALLHLTKFIQTMGPVDQNLFCEDFRFAQEMMLDVIPTFIENHKEYIQTKDKPDGLNINPLMLYLAENLDNSKVEQCRIRKAFYAYVCNVDDLNDEIIEKMIPKVIETIEKDKIPFERTLANEILVTARNKSQSDIFTLASL